MTLATGWKKQYEGNGSATNFPYPYFFVANADLKVIHRSTAGVPTVLTSGVDYALTGAGTLNGNVEFPIGGSFATLAADEFIAILPNVDVAENTNLSGEYQWSTLNRSKDDAMRVSQQQQEQIDRSLKQPITDLDSLDMTIPNSIDRARKQLGFDENGEPIATIAITNTITSGSGAPASTPANLGDIYIDTTGDIFYVATGTASSADWKVTSLITSQAGDPSSTPAIVGLINVDTTNDRIYLSKDTTGATDWVLVNNRFIIWRVLEKDTDHAVGTNIGGDLRLPMKIKVKKVWAYVDTPGTGSVSTFDVNESGTSILSTKITIDATEDHSKDADGPPVISDDTIAAWAKITADTDGIASGDAAKGLTFVFEIDIIV